jgi:3-phenylpropionate/trans-cinnamate dioxygenase ferredoxin subunit
MSDAARVRGTVRRIRPRRSVLDFIRIAAFAEIPDGELRAYDTAVGRVAIAHVEQHLFALGDECTHSGCSLADGELDDRRSTVECPCHGSVFDVETGEPLEGPAVDPVPVFAVRAVDGWVEVAVRGEGEA